MIYCYFPAAIFPSIGQCVTLSYLKEDIIYILYAPTFSQNIFEIFTRMKTVEICSKTAEIIFSHCFQQMPLDGWEFSKPYLSHIWIVTLLNDKYNGKYKIQTIQKDALSYPFKEIKFALMDQLFFGRKQASSIYVQRRYYSTDQFFTWKKSFVLQDHGAVVPKLINKLAFSVVYFSLVQR